MDRDARQQRWQEWFNKALAGMAAQGWRPSYGLTERGNPQCMYTVTKPDGEDLHCIVGQLLCEEGYQMVSKDDALNRMGAGAMFMATLAKLLGLEADEIDRADVAFLVYLQDAHDAAADQHEDEQPRYLVGALQKAASYYDLSMPPLVYPEGVQL